MQLSRFIQLLGLLVLVATLALVARVATNEWRAVQNASSSLKALEQLERGLVAVEMVSRERGPTNAALGDATPLMPTRREALAAARQRTDLAFNTLQNFWPPSTTEASSMKQAAWVSGARQALDRAREAVDQTLAMPQPLRSPEAIRQAVYGMVAVVPFLAPVTNQSASRSLQAYPALGDEVHGARLAAELRESAGLLGSHFTAALASRKPFSTQEIRSIDETRGRIAQLRALLALRAPSHEAPTEIVTVWAAVEAQYFGAAQRLLDGILAQGVAGGRYGMTAAEFAHQYVPHMDSILALRDTLLERAKSAALAEHGRAVQVLISVISGSALLLFVLAVALYVVHRRVLQPLVKTTQVLKALAQDDWHAPLPEPAANDEIAAVIGAVRSLQLHTQQRRALERERDGLIEQLKQQSETDFLTGLSNRRAFMVAAQAMVARASRHGFGVVVVLMDIDHFKLINDEWGHSAGDHALQAVAASVRSVLREGDLAARFGGEEFVILLGHCDRASGVLFAERVREAVAQACVTTASRAIGTTDPGSQVLSVTASLGVADSDTVGLQVDDLVAAADAAMYQAKDQGRNRVVVANSVPAAGRSGWNTL